MYMAQKNVFPVGLIILIIYMVIQAIFPLLLLISPSAVNITVALISLVVFGLIAFGLYKRKAAARIATLVVTWIIVVYQVLSFLIDLLGGYYDIRNFSRLISVAVGGVVIWYVSKSSIKKFLNK